jgi:hypothetical protein
MRLTYLAIGFLLLTINARPDVPTDDWTYAYKVESPGTKSESVHGVLYYKHRELPKEYRDVITPIGKFSFVSGRGLGSSEEVGWVPVGTHPDGNQYFAHTKQDVERLLIKTPLDMRSDAAVQGDAVAIKNRPDNAGANWFYAVKDGLWVNASELHTPTIAPVVNSTRQP